MYRALLLVALLACKRDQPAGLAPASDWQAGDPATAGKPKQPPGGDMAGARGADPHAGVDMTGGADPHAGVDMGNGGPGANPHAGVDMTKVPNTTPEKTDPKGLDKLADGRLVLGPFTLMPPKEWVVKPVTSSMRAAHFVWSEKAGEEAEMIVYYFGEGGAGGVDANLDRWFGQLTQADGKATKDVAKTEKTKFAGQDAVIVQVAGRLQTQQMPGGPPPIDKADGMLLAAIVQSPAGPYYFKGTGSKKTVEANAAKFRAMMASLKLK